MNYKGQKRVYGQGMFLGRKLLFNGDLVPLNMSKCFETQPMALW